MLSFNYRQKLYLHRCKPCRESSGVFLNEHSKCTLIAADRSSVNDIRVLLFAVFIDICHVKTLSKRKVDLNGYNGIFLAIYIFILDIQLRTIKSRFTLSLFVLYAQFIKYHTHLVLHVFPLNRISYIFSFIVGIPL